ncbi:MAG: hypothetical protein A2622_05590 [Bdellovibrionales bacterium RIFCSPHIGHO2_01_FULL_40_29]|nr:MAG: hypothetical protein A2622_05590 [Bdellovibrionales bacterium RIFCSPHIGHO2_01_FULL_40_29]OFZ33131.1 MAG: hypothetical protein A3D17_13280 [Bdellovibrionales bacterium RIFCSPHIGHO2_02_FULL_40_15]
MLTDFRFQKILIIEDDYDFQHVLLDYFSKKCRPAAAVHVVDSCLDGLLRLALNDGDYDLIIVDHNLRGKFSGLVFYRELKEKYPTIPTIMLSGISIEDFVRLTKKQKNVPKFLSKPFSIFDFEVVLRDVCADKIHQYRIAG